ncbi:hypothetical protein COY95_00935, partial [Candidatus Woesearchaeota archaeon CG_4_10_14_0_8_um_filter_47_5]
DTPLETSARVSVEDATTKFSVAIPQTDGTYSLYSNAVTAASAPLQYRFYRGGITGSELLRRNTDTDPLSDDTFDIAKIQGDLEDGFRNAGYNSELVDVYDDYLTSGTNYGDGQSDDIFITNADSYEEWFELDGGTLSAVDMELMDKNGFVSWINDFTDSLTMGVSGGDSDTDSSIEPGETMTLDLSYKVSGAIPSDIDYMYLYDGTTILAVGEDNTQQYTIYVSPDWTPAGTLDYAVDNHGVHDSVFTDGVELRRDSGIAAFSANDQWDVAKISGGLDAEFKISGANEGLKVVDDWNTTSATYNSDGSGNDYWFINSQTDNTAVEEYEVYFEHQTSVTVYDMVITESGTVDHTYAMDDVDDAGWGLAGDGISAGETQDWDLVAEKSGTITEEAKSQPLGGVRITVYNNDGINTGSSMGTDLELFTQTLLDGTYAVYTIPKTYDLAFQKPGFITQYDDELDLSSDVTPNNKEMQYTVRVEVNDYSGQPLAYATVQIFDDTGKTALVNTTGVPSFVGNPLYNKNEVPGKYYYYFPVMGPVDVGIQINKTGWVNIRDPDPQNNNAEYYAVDESASQQVLGSAYRVIN